MRATFMSSPAEIGSLHGRVWAETRLTYVYMYVYVLCAIDEVRRAAAGNIVAVKALDRIR